jgi:hypothetical protein
VPVLYDQREPDPGPSRRFSDRNSENGVENRKANRHMYEAVPNEGLDRSEGPQRLARGRVERRRDSPPTTGRVGSDRSGRPAPSESAARETFGRADGGVGRPAPNTATRAVRYYLSMRAEIRVGEPGDPTKVAWIDTHILEALASIRHPALTGSPEHRPIGRRTRTPGALRRGLRSS